MKMLRVAAGDGAVRAGGLADVMGETGRTPALGLVSRAPFSCTLKLHTNTCCHGEALDCKHLSGPQGLKPAHASPLALRTHTCCKHRASVLQPAGHTYVHRCAHTLVLHSSLKYSYHTYTSCFFFHLQMTRGCTWSAPVISQVIIITSRKTHRQH